MSEPRPITYVRIRLPRFAFLEAKRICSENDQELGHVLTQWVMSGVYEHRRRRLNASPPSGS